MFYCRTVGNDYNSILWLIKAIKLNSLSQALVPPNHLLLTKDIASDYFACMHCGFQTLVGFPVFPRKKSWDHRKITLRYVSIMVLFNTFKMISLNE